MKTVKQELDMIDKLSAIVFAPEKNGADYYKRVVEIIDFIDSYFFMNICPENAGDMTLNELKEILKPKIEYFGQFVPSGERGHFVRASKVQ